MASRSTNHLLHCLNHLTLEAGGAEPTDRQLLQRFSRGRDDRAFAVLLKRYGGLIWGVCRRLLLNRSDAEDAFQATFLVLVQKADSLDRVRALGGWLYRVAYHICLRARDRAATRVKYESQLPPAAPLPEVSDAVADQELRGAFDQALHGLPEKYRAPLVLCYLQGKSHAEAARDLGWPPGSTSRRVAAALDRLRERLEQRGVAYSLAALTVLAAPDSLPAALVRSTLRVARLVTAGHAAARDALPSGVAVLLEGALPSLLLSKRQVAVVLLVALGLIGAGGFSIHQIARAEPPLAQAQQQPAALPAASPPADQAKLLRRDLYGDLLPDSALARFGTLHGRHVGDVFFVGFADNGKALLTAGRDGRVRVWDPVSGKELRRFGKPLNGGNVEMSMVFNNAAMVLSSSSVAACAVTLTADGRTLALADFKDGTVHLFDTSTGKELRQLGPIGSKRGVWGTGVIHLALTPDGRSLITWGPDRVFRLWDTSSGKEVRHFGKAKDPDSGYRISGVTETMVLSPDGKTLAACTVDSKDADGYDVALRVWNVATGQELYRIKQEVVQRSLSTLAFSPDGKWLAWAGDNKTVHLWDVAANREHRLIEDDALSEAVALAFASDGKTLALKREDEIIRLWDLATGKPLRRLGEQARPANRGEFGFFGMGSKVSARSLAFSADGKTLASAGVNGTVRSWKVATGEEFLALGGHQGAVDRTVVSADGKTLTSWSDDNTIRQWDTATGKERHCFRLPNGATVGVFAPDGRTVAFSDGDDDIRLWDLATGKEVWHVPAPKQPMFFSTGVKSFAFAPDGKTLALHNWDQTAYLWDAATGKEMARLTLPNAGNEPTVIRSNSGHRAMVDLAFSPDGMVLATADLLADQRQTRVHLWNLATHKPLRPLDGDFKAVQALAFTPDGRTLAVADDDDAITLWETSTGKRRGRLEGCHCRAGAALAFAPDGRTLAVGSAETAIVGLWEIASGKELRQFQGHRGAVQTVAFTPDGTKVISGSTDTTLLLWAADAVIPRPAAAPLTARDLETCWTTLAGADGTKAFQAMHSLCAAPQQTVSLLQHNLKPAADVDRKRIERCLAALSDKDFAVRQKAAEEVERMGAHAIPVLKDRLAEKPALEVRQRLEQLLEKAMTDVVPTAEALRELRALEVLERIGTANARQVLEKLAQGAERARLTREAKASLQRLAKQPTMP